MIAEKLQPLHEPEIRTAALRDAREMDGMLSRLSSETLHMRFHIPYKSAPGWVLKHFLGAGLRGECIVAAVGKTIVGHAMYAAEEDGREAEIAVVVEDAWQRHGIGKRLLRELARRAKENGIETFSCLILAENQRVSGLAASVFAELETRAVGYERRSIRAPLRSLIVSEGELMLCSSRTPRPRG